LREVADELTQDKFRYLFGGSAHVAVSAGTVALRVGELLAERLRIEIPHVLYPCKWRQFGDDTFRTLCRAHASFSDRVSAELWAERVERSYRAYASIQWGLLPEERKEEISALLRRRWAELPEEVKEQRAQAVSQRWAELPEEVKEQRAQAVSQRWAELPEEERRSFARKMTSIVRQQWATMSSEQKKQRLECFLAARLSPSRKSAIGKAWWARLDDEEKAKAVGRLRAGYASKMTPERQRETGRKRAATYSACPEKRARARQNALRNIDQCRANLRLRGEITADERRRRAAALSATGRRKFISYIEARFKGLHDGSGAPMLERERLTLRARWNITFKFADLDAEVCDKYRWLVMSQTARSKTAEGAAAVSPRARAFIEHIETRYREAREGNGRPWSKSQAVVLRKRMKRTPADLDAGVREKYNWLLSHGS
jgi:hypothetical protein